MDLKYFLPHGQGLQRSRPWVPFPTQGDTCPPTPPLTGGSSPGREVKELPGLASPALLGFLTPPSWGSQLTRPGSGFPSASPQLQPPLRVAGMAGLGWIIQNNSSLAGSPWGRGEFTFQTLVFLSNFPEFLGLRNLWPVLGPSPTPRQAVRLTRCPGLRSVPAYFGLLWKFRCNTIRLGTFHNTPHMLALLS